ncbi:MAG: response regulator [Deltaproteobacteria bacterium]|nr:response regulator [Deltaproteobacteria bacterium]
MSENKKILIIDDDRDYVEALRIVLENNGYIVKHAYNVNDGLKSTEEDRPDLIILDVMMDKHTDGFDFCYTLKHDDAYKHIPILMVTAVTDKTGFKFSPETDGEYCEADDFVSKPVPVSDLVSRVNNLIDKTKAN